MSNLPPTLPVVSVVPPNTTTGDLTVTLDPSPILPAETAARVKTVYTVHNPVEDPKFDYQKYLDATKTTSLYIPPTFALTPDQQSRWQ
jgi:hypothetical protein